MCLINELHEEIELKRTCNLKMTMYTIVHKLAAEIVNADELDTDMNGYQEEE